MYEQPVLAIENEQVFGEVNASVAEKFAAGNAARFLKSVVRAKLRVRNFEGVLEAGLLGEAAKRQYAELGNSDRGQVRERYLSLLEKVDPELRRKFLKIYAYY
jgi:hypothetical protein